MVAEPKRVTDQIVILGITGASPVGHPIFHEA
jgi:hypothetical protein